MNAFLVGEIPYAEMIIVWVSGKGLGYRREEMRRVESDGTLYIG